MLGKSVFSWLSGHAGQIQRNYIKLLLANNTESDSPVFLLFSTLLVEDELHITPGDLNDIFTQSLTLFDLTDLWAFSARENSGLNKIIISYFELLFLRPRASVSTSDHYLFPLRPKNIFGLLSTHLFRQKNPRVPQ